MSTKLFAFMVCMICSLCAWAENKVWIEDFSIAAGQSKNVTIMLNNDHAWYSMDVHLTFPEGLKPNPETLAKNGAVLKGSQTVDIVAQNDGSWLVTVEGNSSKAGFTAVSQALASFDVVADATWSADAEIAVKVGSAGYFEGTTVVTITDLPSSKCAVAWSDVVNVSVSAVEELAVVPGETYEVTVAMDNDIALAGFEATITLPEGLTFVSDGEEFVIGGDRLTGEASISYTNAPEDEPFREMIVNITSSKNNIVIGTTGDIFTFYVQADEELADEIGDIVISGVEVAESNMKPHAVKGIAINVVNAKNPWADVLTSNVEWTALSDNKAYNCNAIVNGETYSALKLGTAKVGGSATITLPVGTTNLYFHAVAWKGSEAPFTVTAGKDTYSFTAKADAGATGNNDFALVTTKQQSVLYTVTFDAPLTQETKVTIATTDKANASRIVVYGVNSDAICETIKIGDAKYATFVSCYDLAIPEGVKVYAVHGVDGTSLDMVEVSEDEYAEDYFDLDENVLYAHQPVILYSEEPVEVSYTGAYDYKYDTTDGHPVLGVLYGTYTDVAAPNGSYVLQNQNNVLGFYQVDTQVAEPKVPAYHCYLQVESSAKAFNLGAAIETAIEKIENENMKAQTIYDLSGRRVNAATKGVFIVNGKKIVK